MRILLFLLKCVVGILATLGLAMVALVLGGLLFWQQFEDWREARDEPLPDRIVLQFDLADGLRDGPASGPLAFAGLDSTMGLRDVLEALDVGSRDPRVAGAIVRLGYGGLSPAQAQELRAALLRFRAADRFALGFAESFGEAGDGNEHYHLATALEEIWLQPTGDLDLIGYRLEQPFIRELLSDWDIVPRAGQRQEWKGLVDMATRDGLSPAVAENLQGVADSLFEELAAAVAEGRGLEEAEARSLINSGPHSADEALNAGLVDVLDYRDRFLDAAMERAGAGAVPMDLGDYLQRAVEAPPADAPRIALLHLQGPIMLGSAGGGLSGSAATGVEPLMAGLAEAAADERVQAVILRIDSPGGSPVASDTLWRAVRRMSEDGKPVIVWLGSVAASGGYYVAVAGDRVVAQPGSLTGSIGVAGGKPVLEAFWPHLGISWDGVQAGTNADIWSPNRDFSPEQWEHFQQSLDRTYADFTAKVAQGRGLEAAALDAATGGRIFTGRDALAAGLVDELGGLPEAVAAAREAAQIPEEAVVAVVDYPESGEALRRLAERFLRGSLESPTELRAAVALLGLIERTAPLIQAFERLQGDPRSRTLQIEPPLSRP